MRQRRLTREEVITIEVLHERGQPARAIARQLGVTEGTVRYRLRRRGQSDGRAKPFRAAAYRAVVDQWLQASGRRVNLAELHEHLVAEYGYSGSVRSLQRYVRATYPPPPRRARRRVETPPGAHVSFPVRHTMRYWTLAASGREHAKVEIQRGADRRDPEGDPPAACRKVNPGPLSFDHSGRNAFYAPL
jgi:transposase